jgi:hypothetical protein
VSRAAVRILHLEPDEDTGELSRLVARARELAAGDLARRFASAGADDIRIVASRADGLNFGRRLRDLIPAQGGLVILGSGSIPLATDDDLRRLVASAASGDAIALTNNRYSSDVLALGDASRLAGIPDLPTDNVLPRWLQTLAGVRVDELGDRAMLALDIDSPLDIELLRRHPACPAPLADLAHEMAPRLERVADAFDELCRLARDPGAQLLVAGRLSADTLRRLETGTACRVRALIEERGLRASAWLAGGRVEQGPAASVIGLLLDRDGAAAIGHLVDRLGDGALLDTRVLLAHRLGADEAGWPSPEDRFASDLLLADLVRDPWLQQLTLHARSHRNPIALGGHTLVGPGLGLALGLEPAAA